MNTLIKHRHVLAPLGGAIVLLANALFMDIGLVASVVAGLLTWAGAAVALQPERPFARLMKAEGLSYDPKLMAAELTEARARIESIIIAARRIKDETVSGSLHGIAYTAGVIIDEVVRDPHDYPRVRKALVHYLGSTQVVADGLAKMQRGDRGTEAGEKARGTLERLCQVFEHYRDAVFENEAFDVETSLAALERDLVHVPAAGGAGKEKRS